MWLAFMTVLLGLGNYCMAFGHCRTCSIGLLRAISPSKYSKGSIYSRRFAGIGGVSEIVKVSDWICHLGSLMSMTTISGAGEKFAFARRCAAAGHLCTTGLSEVWLFWRIVILPV